MWIVFIGPPGAGKGTQARQLERTLGIAHLSTGEMLRYAIRAGTDLGHQAAKAMETGKLVPDEIVLRIMEKRLQEPDCAAGCLFDGFPRTLAQAEALDQLLQQQQASLDLVLELKVRQELLLDRLTERGRKDDNLETIRERLRQYETLTAPLLDYYRKQGILHTISGEGTLDEVFAQLKKAVDECAC